MELRTKVLTGMGWIAGTKFLGQLFTWVITLVIIRLLNPADYGLMTMATLVITFLSMIAELGLGAAIVQRKDLDEETIRKCFGVIILTNFLMFTILFVSAPGIAGFFNEAKLTPVIRLVAVSFLITTFSIVPEALLERELNFKNKSILDLSTVIIGSIVTLILALLNFGVWSLVWGKLATSIIKSIGINIIYTKMYRPSFSFVGMKNIFSFSSIVTLEQAIWFLYTQADSFIIGKLFGKEPLGVYSISLHLATLPMQKISGTINQVAFPAFSSIQKERDKVIQYSLKVARLMSFVAFPITWGISCVSPELVSILLGEKWLEAILPLQLLTLVMPLRMVGSLLPSVLRGVGRADISLGNLLIATAIMPGSFLIGSQWGIIGICYAWLIAFPVVFCIIIYRAMRTIGTPLSTYLATLLKPALAAAGMYLSVYMAKGLLPDGMNPIFNFACLILTGVISYSALIYLFADDLRKELFDLLKKS